MNKKLTALPLCVAVAAVFAAGCTPVSPKSGETFSGVVSEQTYSAREAALQAFLTDETSSYFVAKYVKDETKGALSNGELAALNLTAQLREGLIGGEKVKVSYVKGDGASDGKEPSDNPSTGNGGGTPTYEMISGGEKTYTQTAYLLNYGNTYRYYTPLPEVGEALTNSYYESVVGIGNYENYTFSAKAAQSDRLGDELQTEFSQTVEAKAQKNGIHAVTQTQEKYISLDEMVRYVRMYGNLTGDVSEEALRNMLKAEHASGIGCKYTAEEYRFFGEDIYYSVKNSVKGDFRKEMTFGWEAKSFGEIYFQTSGGGWELSADEIERISKQVYSTGYGFGDFLALEIPFRMADLDGGAYVKTENGFSLSEETVDSISDEDYRLTVRAFDITVAGGRIGKINIDLDFYRYVDILGQPMQDQNGNPTSRCSTYTFDATFTNFGTTAYPVDAAAKAAADEKFAN